MHLQLLDTIDYYNYNKSSVFVSFLDASKALDRVNYCKLFTDLLKREASEIIVTYVYESGIVCEMGHALSNLFSVKNCVKQAGVLSPILFVIYTYGLLKRLQETGVGCDMGHHFSGALAYADDITLLSLKSIRYSYFSKRVQTLYDTQHTRQTDPLTE